MFFKHKKFTDVCIEATFTKKNLDGSLDLRGTFWNLGQSGQSFPLSVPTRAKIEVDKVDEWEYSVDTNENLREAIWLPVSGLQF